MGNRVGGNRGGEQFDSFEEKVMAGVNPTIPLSKLMAKPVCAVCGKDLKPSSIWQTAPDGETYQTCAKCKFKKE